MRIKLDNIGDERLQNSGEQTSPTVAINKYVLIDKFR